MRAMRTLISFLAVVGCALAACSDDKPAAADAAAPAVTLDCATYCGEIQTNCKDANVQYADAGHCMAACAAFPKGTLDDKSGNTLGCRIYHAGAPSAMTPATHCVHAGPGGDKTNAAAPGTCGDACTSFCTLELAGCGMTGDAAGNGQYASMQDCVTKCAAFPNPNNLYSPASKGDSLACRLYHVTNALTSPANAVIHCPHTANAPANPTGGMNPCLAGSPASP